MRQCDWLPDHIMDRNSWEDVVLKTSIIIVCLIGLSVSAYACNDFGSCIYEAKVAVEQGQPEQAQALAAIAQAYTFEEIKDKIGS